MSCKTLFLLLLLLSLLHLLCHMRVLQDSAAAVLLLLLLHLLRHMHVLQDSAAAVLLLLLCNLVPLHTLVSRSHCHIVYLFQQT